MRWALGVDYVGNLSSIINTVRNCSTDIKSLSALKIEPSGRTLLQAGAETKNSRDKLVVVLLLEANVVLAAIGPNVSIFN